MQVIFNVGLKMKKKYWLDPLDKPNLLVSIVNYFIGNSKIILEGNLDKFDFSRIPHLPNTTNIKPESGIPSHPMIILPLKPETKDVLLDQLIPDDKFLKEIIAIQIEWDDKIEFMAGDYFHSECLSVGEGVSENFLSELVTKKILKEFVLASPSK